MNENLREFSNHLRCPITQTRLREMSLDEIEKINSRITKGELFHFDRSVVQRELSVGLISVDSKLGYAVEDDIAILLENLAMVIEEDAVEKKTEYFIKKEKKQVQEFYDQIGWKKGEEEQFVDALKFEDLREVSKDYIQQCHLRVNRYLNPGGKYLLDVASGPIQYPEYLTYSSNYEARICVDISILALKEAKKKLGEKGIYILGDITNLPFEDNSIDGVVSLHTIYHVPEDEQGKAFEEIYRVLSPGCSAAIIYQWENPLPMYLPVLPFRVISKILRESKSLMKRTLEKSPKTSGTGLYCKSHNYQWFAKQKWDFDFELVVWRTLSVPFMRTFIHRYLLGKQFLNLIYWLEERYPYIMARLGQYPIFVINK